MGDFELFWGIPDGKMFTSATDDRPSAWNYRGVRTRRKGQKA